METNEVRGRPLDPFALHIFILDFLSLQGESRLRARPKGFPIALWKPSVHSFVA
jgi:hypothetical protein